MSDFNAEIFESSVPQLVNLNGIGNDNIGRLVVVEKIFPIERAYWCYGAPAGLVRGNHAHRKLKQLIICLSGNLKIDVTGINFETMSFNLDKPHTALFIPPLCWREIHYEAANTVMLCLASSTYDESDYIRNYDDFLKLKADLLK